jgi:hypothetical protein
LSSEEINMAELELLDRGYAAVMDQVVATGTAPHFTELATGLGVELADAKGLVHELIELTPGWTHPGTDNLASFAPFNLQPTHYRASIDGEQRWYAQCGLEAMAIRWLVPGSTVRIDAPCLCCGDPIVVELRDEEIFTTDPGEVVGYTSTEVGGDPSTRPFR